MECSSLWLIGGGQGKSLAVKLARRSKAQYVAPQFSLSRYSFVHESTTTSVIPFRHDEYPRFIQGAYPFYTGAFLVSGSFLLFCYLWLNMGVVEGDRVLKAVDRDGKKTK